MSPQPQTYTAAQYLEAGYRAEMAGDYERAAQYYRYLAEVFTETPEGEAAAAGLMRIATPPRQAAPPPAQHQPHASVQESKAKPQTQIAGSSAEERVTGPRIRLGDLAHHDLTRRPPATNQHRQPAHQPAPQSPAVAAEATLIADGGGDEAMRLPEVMARRARELAELDERIQFEPRYRGARLVAHLLTWVGWIAVAGGLALAVLGFIGVPANLSVAIFGLPGGLVLGVIGIFAGLAIALGGQVALATFDQAQSLREIGVIVRARVDL